MIGAVRNDGSDLKSPKHDRVTEFQMDESKRSFKEALDYRIAVRRFESAFEACDRLVQEDRELLLRQIAERVLGSLPNPTSQKQKTVEIVGIEIKHS